MIWKSIGQQDSNMMTYLKQSLQNRAGRWKGNRKGIDETSHGFVMSILFSHYLIYTICTIWYISVEISNSILWISFGLQNRYICLRFSYKSRWMFKSRKSLNTLPKGEVQDMSFYYETHRGDSITVINTKYVLETISLCSGKKIQNHCATRPCT